MDRQTPGVCASPAAAEWLHRVHGERLIAIESCQELMLAGKRLDEYAHVKGRSGELSYSPSTRRFVSYCAAAFASRGWALRFQLDLQLLACAVALSRQAS